MRLCFTFSIIIFSVVSLKVSICLRRHCEPIVEDQFKKAISDNCYLKGGREHFCFELDHAQTECLLALFLASDQPTNAVIPPAVCTDASFCTASEATKRGLFTDFTSMSYVTVDPMRVNEFPPPNGKDNYIKYTSEASTSTTNTNGLENWPSRGNAIGGNMIVSDSDAIIHQGTVSQTVSGQESGGEKSETRKVGEHVDGKASGEPNDSTFHPNNCVDYHMPYVPRNINDGSMLLENYSDHSDLVMKESTNISDILNENAQVINLLHFLFGESF